MKILFLSFLIFGASAAHATTVKNVRELLERRDYSSASALLSLRLALDSKLPVSEQLRILLLRAVIAAELRDLASAKSLLTQARDLFETRLATEKRFQAELELCEYDVLALESQE